MDEIDKTAVYFACCRKSPSVLKLLTDKDKCNADLEVSDKRGCQLIYVAAARQFDCFQHLLNLGCDIYATDKAGRNALHWATQGGNIKTVRKILDQPGVANNEADLDGWTALCWAARGPIPASSFNSKSQAHVVKLLLEDGADKSIRVQGDGDEIWTPLEIAIYHDTGDEVM